MRIVYDICTPMVVSGGGRPYNNEPGKQGFSSIQADLLITEDCAVNHPELPKGMFHDDTAIYIEGDSKYIIPALEKALSIMKHLEERALDQLGPQRSTNCPDGCDGIEKSNGNHAITCPKHPNFEHFQKEGEGSEFPSPHQVPAE